MQIHLTKTTCMLDGTRHRVNESRPLAIQVDGIDIQTVSEQELLGVNIDEALTWTPQIDNLCSNIS